METKVVLVQVQLVRQALVTTARSIDQVLLLGGVFRTAGLSCDETVDAIWVDIVIEALMLLYAQILLRPDDSAGLFWRLWRRLTTSLSIDSFRYLNFRSRKQIFFDAMEQCASLTQRTA